MRFRVSLLAVVIIVVSLGAPAFAQKRNITEKDLFNFVWIGDPQVAPDGSRVAFVRVTVNDRKDGYNTAIWTVATATGETRQLTNGPRDTTPRWSPDGKYLLFRARAGGERSNGTATVVHVGNGRRRAFSVHDTAPRRGWSTMVTGRKVDPLLQLRNA